MKYIFKQLWFLILLLAISVVLVVGQFKNFFMYKFFEQYLIFAIYVIVVGILSNVFAKFIPRRFNPNKPPFKSFKWEDNGKFYQKKLKINLWKDKLTDVSRAGVTGVEKSLKELDAGRLEKIIQETCVAEVVHAAIIILSPIMFAIMDFPWALGGVIIYDITNLLDIMIQRYNRPRLLRLYQRISKNKSTEQVLV